MRIRHKPYARPALSSCPFFVDEPEKLRGLWHSQFDKERPLHIELGCGKGEFIAQMARKHPEFNYLAVDIKSEILYLAMRAVEASGIDREDNIRLTAFDIERITEILSPGDKAQRIYINFPNPWPKLRHHKHRLVHERQIESYKTFLAKDGEIFFRTDDRSLFEDGIDALKSSGFKTQFETRDLLKSEFADYIGSEHQRMFTEMGLPICFAIASQAAE